MTSSRIRLDLHTPLARLDAPDGALRGSTGWHIVLTLAVVFVLLSTAGWTAMQNQHRLPTPREAALKAWEAGSVAGRPLPDAEAAAHRIRGFFASLNGEQHATLVRRHPLVVGNLDGAPVKLRYEANRVSLTKAIETEKARKQDNRLSDAGQHAAGRRMNRFKSMLSDERQILAFDPTGRGRAAEVFGDLERAARVSIVVPGVDTELLTFERTQLRYTSPVGMAEAVYDKSRSTAPEVDTATIAWADYDSPRGVGMDAATGELAGAGAERLNAFVSGLPGGASVTWMCHSYGSVVCGLAAPHSSTRVTDVAVAGSPGIRLDSAAELEDTTLWAMRAEDDWIIDVPHLNFGGFGHGEDPAEPDFGARLLATEGATGHSEYFEPGTRSLANLAAVGTGSYNSTYLR